MAAGTVTLYSANKDDFRMNDLLTATVKAALVSSSYTADTSVTGHDTWSDVSANELANGNGYSTGGVTLSSKAVTAITGGFKFSSGPISWLPTGSGI